MTPVADTPMDIHADLDSHNQLTSFGFRRWTHAQHKNGTDEVIDLKLQKNGTFAYKKYIERTFFQGREDDTVLQVLESKTLTYDEAITLVKSKIAEEQKAGKISSISLNRYNGPGDADFYHLPCDFPPMVDAAVTQFNHFLDAVTNERRGVGVQSLSPAAQALAKKFTELSANGIDEKELNILNAQAQASKLELFIPLSSDIVSQNPIVTVEHGKLDAVITENNRSVKVKAQFTR